MLIPLKEKYRTRPISSGGNTPSSTSPPKKKTGLAALMENERARELHFMNCARNGWFEQIPAGLLKYYRGIADKNQWNTSCTG